RMLLGRSPRPRVIGEPSQGVFADELVRRLPNGWQFQLTCERYATPDGRSFEGPGLEPDLRVDVFPPGERDGRTDRALEAAIRHLRGR
ncbi:MAG: S41 family peptidase, partial [Gemmatimonadales bacterium]